MRCYICDSYIKKPVFDVKTHKALPCEKCLDVVADTVYEIDEPGEESFFEDSSPLL